MKYPPKKERYWTAGQLFRRGWTNKLLAELLPEPNVREFDGRSVRTWTRDKVIKAEESAVFRAAQAARRLEVVAKDDGQSMYDADAEQALTAVVGFLQEAWTQDQAADESSPAETNIQRLAGFYHQALMEQFPKMTWADRVKSGQAVSYVGHFQALGKGAAADSFAIIKRFLSAGPWMGRNLNSRPLQELFTNYGSILRVLAERALTAFSVAQPEADVDALLALKDFPCQELLAHPLSYLYSVYYVPWAIRDSLALLMALNPKDEYPEARALQRHFILHVGGTNTGKTYAGFQRLAAVANGVYLAPLRLLALEGQEILLDRGIACSLTTGEEEDSRPGDTHVSATTEKLDLKRRFQVAVIDECQMISDPQRGFAWTRAILGVQAEEIHLCLAPQAKDLLIRIIQSCGDTYEVVEHQRKVPLFCMDRTTDYTRVQPGDALIAFSRTAVLSIAEDLRQRGKEPAIIYGALPYATRRKQVAAFLRGEVRYVVSTDAIGMGLNLPIRRIIFLETSKFDGLEQRELYPEEIQQIAGRAGRYGMYDKGYVGATHDLETVAAALHTVIAPLQTAVVGFSDLVLTVQYDLLEVLREWNRMPTVEPYKKLDISRYILIITRLRDAGFQLTKEQELRAANIPFDETEQALCDLFERFLREYKQDRSITRPRLPENRSGQYTLPELERYCRQLDLYFSFAKAFQCSIDTEALYDERDHTADRINQILLHNLKNNIRFCSQCGAALPLYHQGRLCQACYKKRNAQNRYRRN